MKETKKHDKSENKILIYSSPAQMAKNLKCNILFLLSAFAYIAECILFSCQGKVYTVQLAVSFIMITLFVSQIADIKGKIKSSSLPLRIYSAFSAAGICFFTRKVFESNTHSSTFLRDFIEKNNFNREWFLRILSVLFAIMSCAAVYAFVVGLLAFVINKLKPLFHTLTKPESVIYCIMLAALFAFVTYSFFGSNAFWGGVRVQVYDMIYTSDSALIVDDNAYLWLLHYDNDLRQPLFMPFAAPFFGFGYLLSLPLVHISQSFAPVFMGYTQILLTAAANLMLARMLRLERGGRIVFMLFMTCAYSTLLFTVMMEQYVVAFFWLIFAIYSYIENNYAAPFALSAAGGTLLTSLALLPLSYPPENRFDARKFFASIAKSLSVFTALFLAFGRADIFFTLAAKVDRLQSYTVGVSFKGKLLQYLTFAVSCFLAPDAGPVTTYGMIRWQLVECHFTYFSILGIFILLLCAVSLVVNRKDRLTLIAGGWIVFSFVLLCVFGWGARENGMVLYSLYFCWAFAVMLFRLFQFVSKKLGAESAPAVAGGALTIALLICNLKGMAELLQFAFTYYPLNR